MATENGTNDIGELRRIPCDRIRRFANQPRKLFRIKTLQKLAASLKEEGQRTPIEVRIVTDDPEHDYELIDGERRWRASDLAGLDNINAVIKVVEDPRRQFMMSVVANFGREEHTPIEIAHAVATAMEDPKYEGLTKAQKLVRIGTSFSRSDSWAYMYLNMMTLHPEVQTMLEPDADGKTPLSLQVATYLASNVKDQELQFKIARQVKEQGLKRVQAMHLARKMAEDAGALASGRGNRPVDDLRVIRAFISRVSNGAERALDLSSRRFGELFHRQPDEVKQKTVGDIDACIQRLQEMKQAIEGMPSKDDE